MEHSKPTYLTANQLVTKEDLNQATDRILQHILETQPKEPLVYKWLKASEVRKLLKISPNTFTKLKDKGLLKPIKIGAITYFNVDEIEQLMKTNQLKR
ncbi:MAG: helix-turn-helix domain-containing protein [Bacteroidetes bacterium]|nr:helix-turn-helix domain-containing protein [Bacteroidota bacterium]